MRMAGSPVRPFDPYTRPRLARWPIPGRLSQCLLLPVHKLHQLAWPSGRFTPHLEGPLRRRPTVAEVLAYRLVEGQKGSESRGRVGLHSAGGRVEPGVVGWPDSFRYLPISLLSGHHRLVWAIRRVGQTVKGDA